MVARGNSCDFGNSGNSCESATPTVSGDRVARKEADDPDVPANPVHAEDATASGNPGLRSAMAYATAGWPVTAPPPFRLVTNTVAVRRHEPSGAATEPEKKIRMSDRLAQSAERRFV